MDKSYPNRHENRFAELARSLDWRPTKRGWPDFLCYDDDGNAIAVEVKPPGWLLNKTQWDVMKLLSSHGIKCFISDGETLQPFDPELPPDFYAEWVGDRPARGPEEYG